jgi:NADH-quinone oxidoreductase subunit N
MVVWCVVRWLVGLVAGTPQGTSAVLVYLALYLVMTLGTFSAVLMLRTQEGGYLEQISDLAGLGKTNGALAFFLAMQMFSLAGIPPLAGFFAKFYVLEAAVATHFYGLAIVAVLASAVSCYYYLRIVKILYFDEPVHALAPTDVFVRAIFIVCGVLVLGFWIFPAPLIRAAEVAAASLF